MEQASRILIIFCRLLRRERLHIKELATEYKVNERSIARDFRTIRTMLSDLHEDDALLFDRSDKCYYLSYGGQGAFSSMDIMALLKVLIGSRAFRQDELTRLVSAIRSLLPYKDRKELHHAIEDELMHYIEPMHHQPIIKMQWELNHCIVEHQRICLLYTKLDGSKVERDVVPVSIVFAEYYFYLVAFREDEAYEYPAFFRIDRIESFRILGQANKSDRHEGFRYSDMGAAVQFMYAGELLDIKLRCKKSALEAVLDRMPKHKVLDEDGDGFVLVEATVFGEGFLRWVAMQGKAVEILSPKEMRGKLISRFEAMVQMYQKYEK